PASRPVVTDRALCLQFRDAKLGSAELTLLGPAVSSEPRHKPGRRLDEGRGMSLDSLSRGQLVEAVRRFVRERLMPQERVVAEADAVPAGILEEMRTLGLFGLSTPPDYGGLGLGLVDEVHIAFELGQTSPAFRSLFGTNIGIGSLGIVIDGT